MGSKHRIIAVLSALVVLALGVSASAASAALKLEWKVEKAKLGESYKPTLNLKLKSGCLPRSKAVNPARRKSSQRQ